MAAERLDFSLKNRDWSRFLHLSDLNDSVADNEDAFILNSQLFNTNSTVNVIENFDAFNVFDHEEVDKLTFSS